MLLPPATELLEDTPDSLDLLAQLQDQDEFITVSWPPVIYSSRDCDAFLKISLSYMGLESFGQEEFIDDGYITV